MKKWVLVAGLLLNSSLLAQEQQNSASTLHDEYESAAKRYVGILAAEVFNFPPYAEYNREIVEIRRRVQHEGMTEEVLMALIQANNNILTKAANKIGIRVTRMDEFLSYFADNKARYIKPDSPLYERLIAQDGNYNQAN